MTLFILLFNVIFQLFCNKIFHILTKKIHLKTMCNLELRKLNHVQSCIYHVFDVLNRENHDNAWITAF